MSFDIISAHRFHTMPADEYSTAISGGLKLKGVNPSSKISKHRKKKPKFQVDPAVTDQSSKGPSSEVPGDDARDHAAGQSSLKRGEGDDETGGREDGATTSPQAGKTDAEIRHEERRRKRVCDLISSLPYTAVRFLTKLICE